MIRRPAMLNERRESRASFIVLCVLFALVVIILIFDLLRMRYLLIVEVKGDSMLDTLYGGERVGADYEGGDIVYAVRGTSSARGDIVILDTSRSDAYDPYGHAVFTADTVIKRIIATQGDSVKCVGGVVWLKQAGGEYVALDEPYTRGVTPDFEEVVLDEGEIFFLGDNRTQSADSQDMVANGYELLTTDSILGIVPAWAVSIKEFSTAWEGFRSALYSIFT